MVAQPAARGFAPSLHHGQRKKRSIKGRPTSQRLLATNPVTATKYRHHEDNQEEHSHRSRLNSLQLSQSSLESSFSEDVQSATETTAVEIHQQNLTPCSSASSDCSISLEEESPFTRHYTRSSVGRSTAQYQSSKIRRSSRRSRRTKPEGGTPWHERVADRFVKEAQDNNFSSHEVVAYASSLLNQQIEVIKEEQLVLDWSQPASNKPEESILPSREEKVASLNYSNKLRSQAIPAEAFPPSLIKWPGNNNNKQKRLSEIKKQVKLLSCIIKMTIEGAQDQTQGTMEGATAKGGKYNNPAPFTQFVDMTSIPSSAFVNENADEAILPTIDKIQELLSLNKVKEAKAILRTAGGAVTCPTRPQLWKDLCKKHTSEQFSDSFYYDTIQQIYGTRDLDDCRVVLPAFVDQLHLGRCVTAEGMAASSRIISVLAYYYPPITYAPALHPLAASLLLYMNESDVYNSLSALVCSSKVKFLTQTKTSNEVAWRTILVLAKKHVGGGFSSLEKYGVDMKQIETAFQNWLWWILEGIPLPHMVRVLDCFLMEGWKVLVRVSLAIFKLYVQQVSKDTSVAATLTTKGLSEALMIFCKNLTIRPAKLLKTAFGIRALSKSEMQKVMSKTEGVLEKQGDPVMGDVNTHENMTGFTRAVSIEGLPTASAQANVQMLSHTLNVKELLTLWNWMPVRMTMYQPSLLYTTEEHGSSLTSFYQRCENHEPTILLVRTTCDHVFGAYCSMAWNARNKKDEFGNKQTYYGTGESFLFTLRPVPTKYQWVGITQQEKNAALSNVKHSSELFMHGDDDMITIGGGDGQGLTLDHELQYGKTETCLTFDNPPLCPTKDFEVKVVEVYGIDVNQA